MPTRDAVVTYDVKPDTAPEPQQVKVWFSAQGAQQRVDAPDGSASTILNRTTQGVVIVLHRPRVFTRLEERGGVRSPFLLDVSMQYRRKGQAMVAGLPCTEWSVTSGKGDAVACVTADGLILSEHGVDADGISGSLVARSVTYGPLPTSTFDPPAGYQEVHRHKVSAGGGAAAPVLGPMGSSASGAPAQDGDRNGTDGGGTAPTTPNAAGAAPTAVPESGQP